MTVTAEVRSPREVVLLLNGQPIGTCKIKVRIALACLDQGCFRQAVQQTPSVVSKLLPKGACINIQRFMHGA